MYKQFAKLFLIVASCMSFLMSMIISVQAQDFVPTPTVTPSLIATPSSAVLASGPDNVTFAQFGRDEIELTGPYDGASFSFALPADWKLTGGAELKLFMGVSFISTAPQGTSSDLQVGGGTFTVTLNGVLLGVFPLNETGEIERSLSIPIDAFAPFGPEGFSSLRFTLDSSQHCEVGDQLLVLIYPSSYFTLPHDLVLPDTNLVNFPRPIYQSSFVQDLVLIVVPDHPTSAEMQAALTVGAGLGKLSGNSLLIDMTTQSQLTPEQEMSNHIVLVGNAGSLPAFSELKFPLPAQDGAFQVDGGDPSDGIIQMINSPWSDSHVVLVVSGNSDQGTVKAAQAISTGVLRPNRFPNLAVVQKVETTPLITSWAIDRTLADLEAGYTGNVFRSRGQNTVVFNFNVPSGVTISPDAYFELNYSNSALLAYERSGIVVTLNRRPIGSVRLSDATANQAINKTKILIPPSALVVGNNQLEISASLIPRDICTPPTQFDLWVNIWPESTLHLPLGVIPAESAPVNDLTDYPAPFIYDSSLGDTAFVLASADSDSWRSAVQLAFTLGGNVNGPVLAPSVFYSDDFPEEERGKYQILVVGRPNEMPIMKEMNDYLPAPFQADSENASEDNFQVIYRIPLDSPLGYLEMMPSPWNSGKIVLAVLGNSPQGLGWATSSLIDPNLSLQLIGDFAAVNDQQIITTDTRTVVVPVNSPANSPNIITTPQPSNAVLPLPSSQNPSWILPALVASIILIVLVFAGVIIRNWTQTRTRGRNE